MLADVIVDFDDVGIVFTRLVGEVPTGKALVVSVACVGFVDERFVEIDFFPPGAPPPVESGIIGTEVKLEVVFVGQRKEHLADVFVDRQQAWNHMAWIDAFVFVARPDDDDGVEADARVEFELASPLSLRPVLAGDIVGYFVKKGSRDPGERRHGGILLVNSTFSEPSPADITDNQQEYGGWNEYATAGRHQCPVQDERTDSREEGRTR